MDLDLLLIRDPRRMYQTEGIYFKLKKFLGQNNILAESGKFLIFERKGIKTDLFAIEGYVEEILEEVLSTF